MPFATTTRLEPKRATWASCFRSCITQVWIVTGIVGRDATLRFTRAGSMLEKIQECRLHMLVRFRGQFCDSAFQCAQFHFEGGRFHVPVG